MLRGPGAAALYHSGTLLLVQFLQGHHIYSREHINPRGDTQVVAVYSKREHMGCKSIYRRI